MRKITLTLKIEGVDMTTSITEDEYAAIKESTRLDPLLMSINRMWEEVNKHQDLKDNPIAR